MPASDEDFLKQLREAFAVEAAEHLQAMTNGLLELEKSPQGDRRTTLVEGVFRNVHSLKGAARAVNCREVESLCQAMEEVFSQWKQSTSPIPPETFDVLSRALDLLEHVLKQPGNVAAPAEEAKIRPLTRELAALCSRRGRSPSPIHPSTPPSISPVPAPTPEPAPAPAPPIEPEIRAQDPDFRAPAETVRVPMAKMDALLRRAEELIAVKLSAARNTAELRQLSSVFESWRKEWGRIRGLARSGLAEQAPAALAQIANFLEWNQNYMQSAEKRLASLTAAFARDERVSSALIDDLLEDAKRVLMLPFGTLLEMFPKVVRDLARAQEKEVNLILHGREVEIDKRILQEIKDPLIHLARNSVDHGIESPAAREAAGKHRSGMLTMAVSQLEGSKVEILVQDDGSGIDAEKVKASAIRAGTLTEENAATMDEQAALGLIFESGVSTSPMVSEISGRGIGMAIAREKVEKLGGHISIETQRGAGTAFRIVLPVTLATYKGILVYAGGQPFIIPSAKLERITRTRRENIQTVENRETITLDGQAVAFARLDTTLRLPPAPSSGDHVEVVVLGSGERRIAFAVDSVLSEQEVLVKGIGHPLRKVRNVAGATVLASGTPAVILNPSDLLNTVTQSAAAPRQPEDAAMATLSKRNRRVLVADDSLTSRILLKNILESADYEVTTAIDGVDAITSLKTGDFDLLVSDVEMPRMNGFELTAKVRSDPKLAELPVVLVTALASREFQERGVDAGANAYIVKSSFDQSDLLEVIQRLL